MNDWLYILFHPSYWMQVHPFSPTWDNELRKLLDSGERFKIIDEYNASIGGHEVWITNHPYGSFSFNQVRPRRTTIRRANKVLLTDAGHCNRFELQERFIKEKLG